MIYYDDPFIGTTRTVDSFPFASRKIRLGEVVDEGLRLVEQRLRKSDEKKEAASSSLADHADDRASVQLRNLSRLGQKLDAMPAAATADGLSNRDHDRMLYGQ